MAPRFSFADIPVKTTIAQSFPSGLPTGEHHFPGGHKLIVTPNLVITGQVPQDGPTLPTPGSIPGPPKNPPRPPKWWTPEKPKFPPPPLPPQPPKKSYVPPVKKPKPAPKLPRPILPATRKPKLAKKSGPYWVSVPPQIRNDLGARGISGSEWYWSDYENTARVVVLCRKLQMLGIWQFVGKIREIWFGPIMFGIKFEPKKRTTMLTHLNSSKRLKSSVGSSSSKFNFREKAEPSVHIHGNGSRDWEAHIDYFYLYAHPVEHFIVDYVTGKIYDDYLKKRRLIREKRWGDLIRGP